MAHLRYFAWRAVVRPRAAGVPHHSGQSGGQGGEHRPHRLIPGGNITTEVLVFIRWPGRPGQHPPGQHQRRLPLVRLPGVECGAALGRGGARRVGAHSSWPGTVVYIGR